MPFALTMVTGKMELVESDRGTYLCGLTGMEISGSWSYMVTEDFQRILFQEPHLQGFLCSNLASPRLSLWHVLLAGQITKASPGSRGKQLVTIYQGRSNKCFVVIISWPYLTFLLAVSDLTIRQSLTAYVERQKTKKLLYIALKFHALWGTSLRKEEHDFPFFPFSSYQVVTNSTAVSRGNRGRTRSVVLGNPLELLELQVSYL